MDPALRKVIGPDDILQSTYLVVARDWPTYQRGSPMQPYPWLYRHTMDRYLEAYRKFARTPAGQGRTTPLGDDISAFLGGQFWDTGTGARLRNRTCGRSG